MSFVYISRQYDVVTNVPNILTSKKKRKKKRGFRQKKKTCLPRHHTLFKGNGNTPFFFKMLIYRL